MFHVKKVLISHVSGSFREAASLFKAILAVGALYFDFEIRLLPCW